MLDAFLVEAVFLLCIKAYEIQRNRSPIVLHEPRTCSYGCYYPSLTQTSHRPKALKVQSIGYDTHDAQKLQAQEIEQTRSLSRVCFYLAVFLERFLALE